MSERFYTKKEMEKELKTIFIIVLCLFIITISIGVIILNKAIIYLSAHIIIETVVLGGAVGVILAHFFFKNAFCEINKNLNNKTNGIIEIIKNSCNKAYDNIFSIYLIGGICSIFSIIISAYYYNEYNTDYVIWTYAFGISLFGLAFILIKIYIHIKNLREAS